MGTKKCFPSFWDVSSAKKNECSQAQKAGRESFEENQKEVPSQEEQTN